MAIVVRSSDRLSAQVFDKVRAWELLGTESQHGLPATDGRVTVSILEIEKTGQLTIETEPTELVWLQILSGQALIDHRPTDTDHIVALGTGKSVEFRAVTDTRLFIARVPRAHDYDPNLPPEFCVRVDWSTEPVLNSEHDTRKRIYLASPALWGTDAVKGEMIIYPPGASGAEHHHIGAEHFQYIISGSGMAVLDGEEVLLHQGDLLYNFENEPHWFHNPGESDDMVFVEFFVPGASQTIWSPGANACGWVPTGLDAKGREPARELKYHIHGEGKV